MSRDQRAHDNWALLFAQEMSLASRAPLVVIFCLAPRFLEATARHYLFMLKGLQEVERDLAKYNISFFLVPGSPGKKFLLLSNTMTFLFWSRISTPCVLNKSGKRKSAKK